VVEILQDIGVGIRGGAVRGRKGMPRWGRTCVFFAFMEKPRVACSRRGIGRPDPPGDAQRCPLSIGKYCCTESLKQSILCR
jgi:hypothetical protein